ncbi:unnamed protein product [Heterobilharzia americana]|nr:unnamed protein product [Heterobilharzia americana]
MDPRPNTTCETEYCECYTILSNFYFSLLYIQLLDFVGINYLTISDEKEVSTVIDKSGHILSPNPEEVAHVYIRSISWLTNPANYSYTKYAYSSPDLQFLSNDNQLAGTYNGLISQRQQFYVDLPPFGALSNPNSCGPRIWGLTVLIIINFCIVLFQSECIKRI